MNRRERMLATLRGEHVDRPAFNFYEIDGFSENPSEQDPFNIYAHPSWKPLIELARDKTDRLPRRHPPFKGAPPDPVAQATTWEEKIGENGSKFTTRTVKVGGKTLVSRLRRDPDVNTVWTYEHLLKTPEDLETFLQLPEPEVGGEPDISGFLKDEQRLGDSGVILIDTADPLCCAADLFDMAEYTVVAMSEPELFHRVLERFAKVIQYRTEKIAKALPGRLWRIVGSEYASPPYLPPRLYREYEVRYTKPMVEVIKKHGGYPRLHSHGRLHDILDDIVGMGVVGLDPIEPPPQGDVELKYVREKYGKDLILFGNLEASDIEHLETPAFAEKIKRALDEGTSGQGRGFVLQPSACPYGRVLPTLAMRNYEMIVELVEKF